MTNAITGTRYNIFIILVRVVGVGRYCDLGHNNHHHHHHHHGQRPSPEPEPGTPQVKSGTCYPQVRNPLGPSPEPPNPKSGTLGQQNMSAPSRFREGGHGRVMPLRVGNPSASPEPRNC